MPKKIPIRQCVACREHREKPLLARVVRTPGGEVVFAPGGRAPGGGAYLCRSPACLEKAVKSRALARALETDITPEIYETLRRQMEQEGSE